MRACQTLVRQTGGCCRFDEDRGDREFLAVIPDLYRIGVLGGGAAPQRLDPQNSVGAKEKGTDFVGRRRLSIFEPKEIVIEILVFSRIDTQTILIYIT